MPRKKKTKEVVEETPKVVAKEEVVEETKGVATVEWRGRSREYSKEIHGKDYRKLAESFAEKFNGVIK